MSIKRACRRRNWWLRRRKSSPKRRNSPEDYSGESLFFRVRVFRGTACPPDRPPQKPQGQCPPQQKREQRMEEVDRRVVDPPNVKRLHQVPSPEKVQTVQPPDVGLPVCRGAEELLHVGIQCLGKRCQHLHVRPGAARLIVGDRLPGDVEDLGQLVLTQLFPDAQSADVFSNLPHGAHLLRCLHCSARRRDLSRKEPLRGKKALLTARSRSARRCISPPQWRAHRLRTHSPCRRIAALGPGTCRPPGCFPGRTGTGLRRRPPRCGPF